MIFMSLLTHARVGVHFALCIWVASILIHGMVDYAPKLTKPVILQIGKGYFLIYFPFLSLYS